MDAIDLFSGMGGFTEAAKQAGVKVVWAGNHWQLAVETHKKNHPSVIHVCQDLHQADWDSVPAHDLLLASPACQGHTPARGKEQVRHDTSRTTAWAVVSALERRRPSFGVVENVPEFMDWTLYPSWADAIGRLGYSIAPHVIDSADHGVPQHRTRVYLVLTRSKSPLRLKFEPAPHRPIGEIIEWDHYRWSPIADKVPATRARIENGRKRFGERFLIPYYGSGSGLTGRSLDRPIGTITTLDRWGLVNGDMMRMMQPSELRGGMAFPDTYLLPRNRRQAIHLLGNAVTPPPATDIITALKKAA